MVKGKLSLKGGALPVAGGVKKKKKKSKRDKVGAEAQQVRPPRHEMMKAPPKRRPLSNNVKPR